MTRSCWKPLTINYDVVKFHLFVSNLSKSKSKNFLTNSSFTNIFNQKRIITSFYSLRNTTILLSFVGLPFLVHNGQLYYKVLVKRSMVGLKLGAYVFTKKMGLQIHAKILDKKPNKSLLEQKRLMGIEGNLKFLNIKKKKK